MSAKDQALSAELHGEALLTAKRPELQPLIDHLREVAQGRDDIRVECAGAIAGGCGSVGGVAAGQIFRTGRDSQERNPRCRSRTPVSIRP